MDFGVAKLDSSKLTSQGDVLGSPGYMAPEQALEARVDPRSDVFSLGTVLYETLTGKRAFGHGTFSEILMRLAYENPVAPSRLIGDIPPEVDEIVAHAMAKRGDDRYASAEAMAADIEAVLARYPPGRAPDPVASVSRPSGAGLTTPGTAAVSAPAGLPRGPLTLPAGKRVSLKFLSGPRAGEEHVFRHASLLIGREGGDSGAAIELPESQISRMHAMIEARGQRFVLRDLESKNGTFVGGERVKEQEIEPGTEFQIGSTRLVIVVTDMAP
jgi:serine/threonine protein kinase